MHAGFKFHDKVFVIQTLHLVGKGVEHIYEMLKPSEVHGWARNQFQPGVTPPDSGGGTRNEQIGARDCPHWHRVSRLHITEASQTDMQELQPQ